MWGRGAYPTCHNFLFFKLFANLLAHNFGVNTHVFYCSHVHCCVILFFITSVICHFTFLLFKHFATYCFSHVHGVDALATCYIDDVFSTFHAFHILITFHIFHRRVWYTMFMHLRVKVLMFMHLQCSCFAFLHFGS